MILRHPIYKMLGWILFLCIALPRIEKYCKVSIRISDTFQVGHRLYRAYQWETVIDYNHMT